MEEEAGTTTANNRHETVSFLVVQCLAKRSLTTALLKWLKHLFEWSWCWCPRNLEVWSTKCSSILFQITVTWYCYGYGILLVLLLLVHGHFSRWGLIVGLGPALRSQKPVWWHRQSMRPHCDSHHSSFLCFSLSDAECWSVCRGQPKFGALTLWLYFNDVVDSHVVTNGGNGIIDLSVETKLKVSSRQ